MTKLIRLPEVLNRTGISRSLVYKLIKEDSFPKQINTSPRTSGWLESEIDEWIEERVNLSRSKLIE